MSEIRNDPVRVDKNRIYLSGRIAADDWWDEECISASKVTAALKEIESDAIELHINSPGGDVFESFAIHNELKNCGKEVTVIIDGIAASGAAIIAMAGSKIKMNKLSIMMIHKAHTIAWGNVAELEKVIRDLGAIDECVAAAFEGRYAGDTESLNALLDSERFMTASTALALGLCDEIIDQDVTISVQNSVEEAKKMWAKTERKVEAKTEESPEENKPEHERDQTDKKTSGSVILDNLKKLVEG